MGDHTAFFYGTLMAPGVLYRVIYGTSKPEEWQKKLTHVRPALLPAFRRHRVAHADFPAIVPKDGSTVRGSIVTGLTEGDIYRLDIFEGDMYKRDKVQVKVLQDSLALDHKISDEDLAGLVVGEEEAETYVWCNPVEQLEEKEWDFEQFKREKMMAWMGEVTGSSEVDEGFADVDRAVAEEEARLREKDNGLKDDPSGGRVNGRIARELEKAGA